MHKYEIKMWDIIPNSIKQLHNLFKNKNKSLFVVGGCVRDFLKNETPKDYDLATDATPEEVLSITSGFKSHLHGESFGVVVIYTEDNPEGFEIATFREDIYGDKLGETRNPDVKFSTIDKDVLRRDLTFNALFYDLDKKEVIDLVGGIEDINNKITRFVGEPEMRIKEDPLRILRLFRFNNRYNFSIEEKSLKAIINNKEMLSIITKERIWEEIKKAFIQVKDFKLYLKDIIETGVANVIFEKTILNSNLIEADLLEMHIANLFINNDTIGFLDKMKFEFKMEHNFARRVVFLIDILKLTDDNVLKLYKANKICNFSEKELSDWFLIFNLNKYAHKAFLKYEHTTDATKLMELGFKGKALGKEIERLELKKFKELVEQIEFTDFMQKTTFLENR